MANHQLANYLNNHLAGSVAGLELMGHLERTFAGGPVGRFAAALREEVAADRRELEALMARLHIAESGPRKAAAWVTEKGAELKLWLDDPAPGALRVLEVLEALSVGIEGKRLLWCALAAAAEVAPHLRETDYARLERRAEEQRRSVETVRQAAAKAALGSTPAVPNFSERKTLARTPS